MKKSLIAILGIVVLAGGSYAISKMISKKKSAKNLGVVQLENGQEIKINTSKKKGEFDREGDKPDIVGQIKSINDDSIIVEQFDMSNMGSHRSGEKLSAGEKIPTERPAPTVSGEVTIVLQEETSYVKGSQERMRPGARNENKNSKLEEISKNDLEEGNMVSIWTLDDKTAERIMVR